MKRLVFGGATTRQFAARAFPPTNRSNSNAIFFLLLRSRINPRSLPCPEYPPLFLSRWGSRLSVACRYLAASRIARHVRVGGDVQHKTTRKILSSLSKWLPIKQPEFTARKIVFIIRNSSEQRARYVPCQPVI